MRHITLFFGWTVEQWAHAKARHARLTKVEVPPNVQGMGELQRWWLDLGYAPPLSLGLEGFQLETDEKWATRAMCDALSTVCGPAERQKHEA